MWLKHTLFPRIYVDKTGNDRLQRSVEAPAISLMRFEKSVAIKTEVAGKIWRCIAELSPYFREGANQLSTLGSRLEFCADIDSIIRSFYWAWVDISFASHCIFPWELGLHQENPTVRSRQQQRLCNHTREKVKIPIERSTPHSSHFEDIHEWVNDYVNKTKFESNFTCI